MYDYSPKTLRAMFGKPLLPTLPMTLTEVAQQAQKLAGRLSISGVQPKLGVTLLGNELVPVPTEGRYILKPQTQTFNQLPENEHLCMSMGETFGLNVPGHLLLPLADGSPAYVVKRFDRYKQGSKVKKRPCEDMNQILGGDKYGGSHEQVAKAIRAHATFPTLELQRFFELTLFSFAIGNGDAHKKNVSLLTTDDTVALSPVYDLVSSRLVIPDEADELALPLNGRQNRLARKDFLAFAATLQLTSTFAEQRIAQLVDMQAEFARQIADSALSEEMRARLVDIVGSRLKRLKMA